MGFGVMWFDFFGSGRWYELSLLDSGPWVICFSQVWACIASERFVWATGRLRFTDSLLRFLPFNNLHVMGCGIAFSAEMAILFSVFRFSFLFFSFFETVF